MIPPWLLAGDPSVSPPSRALRSGGNLAEAMQRKDRLPLVVDVDAGRHDADLAR